MKIAKKDITTAIKTAPSHLNDQSIRAMQTVFLGYYTPADANWSYELHVISENNTPIMVAARFGSIIAEG